ncbi:hypothetical protein ACQUQU_15975 [Thalassolituus sp. LLYu03]|uniref:hypothetical protein n=1 Tax=Thalassolituus sp. LLYu03 TaxID=3421656 RepID=UPI003D298378
MRTLRHLTFILPAVIMAGCATYGAGVTGAIQDVQKGDFAASEAKFKQALKPDGNDRLLYNLELGVVKHLEGDFNASNGLLDQAERIAEDLETISVTSALATMMSNPRQGPYGGADFEKVFINYYKALNYFGLAQLATTRTDYENALEGARIESRRLIIRLNDIKTRKGSYSEQKSKDQETFTKLLKIFEKLQGNLVDMDRLQYRDDAMAHYLTGISFEMNHEYDDARISYQNAAQAYEDGYAKQFRLGDDITQQAWFDTIRMMRWAGGYDTEWRALAKKKLSKTRQAELDEWTKDKAQVVVLEHKGLAPQRQEMNLDLSVNPSLRALEIRPYFLNNRSPELAWFYVLYADKNIFDAVTNYLDAAEVGYWFSSFTKTVPIGPLWNTADDIGLIGAIGNSMRITVPYYEPVKPLGESVLRIDGKAEPMIKSANPALMAVQEQMVNAGTDIQLALARSSLKAILAQSAANLGGSYGSLLASVGKLTAQLTDAAETRNWLLLPADIRVRREIVEPGEHQLNLDSQMLGSQRQSAQQSVSLKAGDIHLWRVRTLPPLAGQTESDVKKLIKVSE